MSSILSFICRQPWAVLAVILGVTAVAAVQLVACLLGIAGVLKLDKSKSRGVAGNPNVRKLAKALEFAFQLALGRIRREVSNVHTRHGAWSECFHDTTEQKADRQQRKSGVVI